MTKSDKSESWAEFNILPTVSQYEKLRNNSFFFQSSWYTAKATCVALGGYLAGDPKTKNGRRNSVGTLRQKEIIKREEREEREEKK